MQHSNDGIPKNCVTQKHVSLEGIMSAILYQELIESEGRGSM